MKNLFYLLAITLFVCSCGEDPMEIGTEGCTANQFTYQANNYQYSEAYVTYFGGDSTVTDFEISLANYEYDDSELEEVSDTKAKNNLASFAIYTAPNTTLNSFQGGTFTFTNVNDEVPGRIIDSYIAFDRTYDPNNVDADYSGFVGGTIFDPYEDDYKVATITVGRSGTTLTVDYTITLSDDSVITGCYRGTATFWAN